MIPLKKMAYDELASGRIGALDLDERHIESGVGYSALLLDTWVVAEKHRAKTDRYGDALILKHLGEFWDPDHRRTMTLLVQPDNHEVTALLGRMGFVGPIAKHQGESVFVLRYPADLHKARAARCI